MVGFSDWKWSVIPRGFKGGGIRLIFLILEIYHFGPQEEIGLRSIILAGDRIPCSPAQEAFILRVIIFQE